MQSQQKERNHKDQREKSVKQRLKKQQKKTKSLFFKRVNKIDKPLARLTKRRKKNTQEKKIRNKKG